MNESIKKLSLLLKESKYAVVLTGAGMSTESGIPDFRSKDGLRGQNECHLSTSVLGNISTSLLALSVYGNISNLSLECIPYF